MAWWGLNPWTEESWPEESWRERWGCRKAERRTRFRYEREGLKKWFVEMALGGGLGRIALASERRGKDVYGR